MGKWESEGRTHDQVTGDRARCFAGRNHRPARLCRVAGVVSNRGWTCRKVGCATINDPRRQKCVTCGCKKPKKRVPEHRKALRDVTYEDYLVLTQEMHGVYEECAVCGRPRDFDGRRLDRDHDHTAGAPHSGKPRGLVCVSCNILMPPKLTPEKARQIAAYLTRVEEYYGVAA